MVRKNLADGQITVVYLHQQTAKKSKNKMQQHNKCQITTRVFFSNSHNLGVKYFLLSQLNSYTFLTNSKGQCEESKR